MTLLRISSLGRDKTTIPNQVIEMASKIFGYHKFQEWFRVWRAAQKDLESKTANLALSTKAQNSPADPNPADIPLTVSIQYSLACHRRTGYSHRTDTVSPHRAIRHRSR